MEIYYIESIAKSKHSKNMNNLSSFSVNDQNIFPIPCIDFLFPQNYWHYYKLNQKYTSKVPLQIVLCGKSYLPLFLAMPVLNTWYLNYW